MTEASSKGLTWGTLLAGVVSALALAAIGCIKPIPSRDSAGQPGNGMQGSSDAGSAQPGYASRESVQRQGDDRRRSASH